MTQTVNPDYANTLSGLKDRGYSIPSWARENDFKPTSVYDAAKGYRNGPKSRLIRRRLAKTLATEVAT